jgi:hypothetical protein
MAELQLDDFVLGPHGTRRLKRALLGFHGRMTDWTPEQNELYHKSLRTLAIQKIAKERQWAEALGMDMHAEDWLLMTERLNSIGFIVVVRTEWDGLDTCTFVKLKDDERRVKLTASGGYFAGMSFQQAMQIAGER